MFRAAIDLAAFGDDTPYRIVAAASGVIRYIVDRFGENRPGMTPCNNNYIRLALPSGTVEPQDGYFMLDRAHNNYEAIYSLALSSAINGYVLSIRTVRDITPSEHAEVEYVVVDW